jgi:hypothetical protein
MVASLLGTQESKKHTISAKGAIEVREAETAETAEVAIHT